MVVVGRGRWGKSDGSSQSATTKVEELRRELNCSHEVICTSSDIVEVDVAW